MSEKRFAEMNFDGACRGNPGGKSSGGAFIRLHTENLETAAKEVVFHSVGIYIGSATVNEAEYAGLIHGIKKCVNMGVTHLEIKGDSSLVVNQISGKWATKAQNLKPRRKEALRLLNLFDSWTIEWVPRSMNSEADAAANNAIDNRSSADKAPEPIKTIVEAVPFEGLEITIKYQGDEFKTIQEEIDLKPSQLTSLVTQIRGLIVDSHAYKSQRRVL